MSDYVTTDQVGGFAQQFAQLDSTSQSLLVTAASRLFDNNCEVAENFFAEAASPAAYTARRFVGDGTAYLKLDPYSALNPTDPVKFNDGTIETEDFTVTNVPDYIASNGSLVVLDKAMRFPETATATRYEGWPLGKQIEVSANWGWSSVPSDVQLATIHLAIHLWRTSDPAFAVLSQAGDAANRIETIPKVARDIIDRYREKYSRRALFG